MLFLSSNDELDELIVINLNLDTTVSYLVLKRFPRGRLFHSASNNVFYYSGQATRFNCICETQYMSLVTLFVSITPFQINSFVLPKAYFGFPMASEGSPMVS